MKRMDEVFVSMTFGGYTLGIAAAIEVIAMMREFGDVHSHMHELGTYLITKGNNIAKQYELPIEFIGLGAHPVMQVPLEDYISRLVKTYIYQEMHEAGIFFSSSMMIGYIHTKEHIDTVLVELEKFARRLRLYGAISNSWSRLYTDSGGTAHRTCSAVIGLTQLNRFRLGSICYSKQYLKE